MGAVQYEALAGPRAAPHAKAKAKPKAKVHPKSLRRTAPASKGRSAVRPSVQKPKAKKALAPNRPPKKPAHIKAAMVPTVPNSIDQTGNTDVTDALNAYL